MLLILALCVSSAFAAPSIDTFVYDVDSYPAPVDNGKLISSYVTDRIFETIDGGDMPFYVRMVLQTVNDMANVNNPNTQATAALQSLVTLGEMANGVPGDACVSASLINAYANNNKGALRANLANFVELLSGYIDRIVQLVNNPNSVRSSAGPRGNCIGGGKTYEFESAWNGILDAANAFEVGLLNEEYCLSKRLYRGFNTANNDVGAAVTACATPPVRSLALATIKPLASFLRVVAGGGNPGPAGAALKGALLQALGSVSV